MPTKMQRIAVVTGGGSEIGAAVAKALAKTGGPSSWLDDAKRLLRRSWPAAQD